MIKIIWKHRDNKNTIKSSTIYTSNQSEMCNVCETIINQDSEYQDELSVNKLG